MIGYYGSDETIALSAWTSTSRDLTEDKRARIPSLIKMLADNNHGTPFEKSFLHFLVTCDTASKIHLLKHRIGVNVNGESARYKELKDDKYYIPHDWPNHAKAILRGHLISAYSDYHYLIKILLDDGMDRKRAKESARLILPYANQLTMDVSFNMRSFIHFQKLRNSSDAQLEIREIAEEMLRLVKETGAFKYSLEAFGY